MLKDKNWFIIYLFIKVSLQGTQILQDPAGEHQPLIQLDVHDPDLMNELISLLMSDLNKISQCYVILLVKSYESKESNASLLVVSQLWS